jgi:hypothetical protein
MITALVLLSAACLLVFDYVWRLFSFPIKKVIPAVMLLWVALLAGVVLLFR